MTQQIVIIEGLDMTGKTTIINALTKKLGIHAYKEIRQEKWYDHLIDLVYSEEARIQMVEQIGFSIIFDRAYPSEWVYSAAYDRLTHDEKLIDLDDRYAKLNTKIVIMYKDLNKVKEDKTGLIDFDKYKIIHDLYMDFSEWTSCDTLLLDTTSENLEEQLNKIINFIKE